MLKINSMCPDFQCKTTEGDISFHEWLGDSWGVLFSHPKDFTPVCTTELGSLGQMKAEFDARNVKVIGLSVDGVEDQNFLICWKPMPEQHQWVVLQLIMRL